MNQQNSGASNQGKFPNQPMNNQFNVGKSPKSIPPNSPQNGQYQNNFRTPSQPYSPVQQMPSPNSGGTFTNGTHANVQSGINQPNMNRRVPPMQPMGKNQPGIQMKNGSKKKKNGGKTVGYVFLGILIMLVIIGLGIWGGYQTAISARKSEEKVQKEKAAEQQFQLALADINNGKYENAKTRLDYVKEINPNYPGLDQPYITVYQKLANVATATPYVTPTPVATSTPDTRDEDQMVNGILSAMVNQQWEDAINQMDALRDKDLNYRSLDIDGMYYIALRNWGIQLINNGYLESGVYKITLAESFGPIDGVADSMRSAARSYLAGAGFWEIDWTKALNYYSNAYTTFPNLFDQATKLTALQRYAESSFGYAGTIASSDACEAVNNFNNGLALAPNDSFMATYALTATEAYNTCNPPAAVVVPDEAENVVTTDATATIVPN